MLRPLAAASYGTSGLTAWIHNNVVTLVLLLLAVAVLWAAKNGNIAKGVTILAGAFIGLLMLGLASGTTASDVGDFAISLFKG